MNIGPYQLSSPVFLAPMAGITDRPFRQLCRQLGAGLVVSEMVTSDPGLRNSQKTRLRLDHNGEQTPISVQIAGTEASQMADAARYNVDNGAQIIDINMGCPAKKVCNVMAGSALLKDERKVADILKSIVDAVDVPVTLKTRTGWDKNSRNALRIAHIAEDCGIQALSLHGRTRACGYRGEAEYDTIAQVKAAINIPVIANGDIDSPQKARQVLDYTGADAVMIGRAAQGRPWIFREINHYLQHGEIMAAPSVNDISDWIQQHLKNLYDFYGEYRGVRIARKHIGWYCKTLPGADDFRKQVNPLEDAVTQLDAVIEFIQESNKKLIINYKWDSCSMNNVVKLNAIKGDSVRISLSESVKTAIAQYLSELDGEHPGNIYDLVMTQVEEPLLELVLDYVDGNQSRAAECLGINRGTLRKKLKTYELIK